MIRISKKNPTNLSASIQNKLKNHARKLGIPVKSIYLAYIFEKFFYRLMNSKYSPNLILKGGVLLYCDSLSIRQTTDIDFLCFNLPNNTSSMEKIIREICEIENNDALLFHLDTLTIEKIMIAKKYGGMKAKIRVNLGTIRELLQIDLEFNDVIYPQARTIQYPLILPDAKPIQIMGYTQESFVAEKIHAIYYLGDFTSRMKDYFDLYKLAEKIPFNQIVLLKAIRATFKRRETKIISKNLMDILSDDTLSTIFAQYCKKKNLSLIPFEVVTSRLKEMFLPIFLLIEEGVVKYKQVWDTHTQQWNNL